MSFEMSTVFNSNQKNYLKMNQVSQQVMQWASSKMFDKLVLIAKLL